MSVVRLLSLIVIYDRLLGVCRRTILNMSAEGSTAANLVEWFPPFSYVFHVNEY